MSLGMEVKAIGQETNALIMMIEDGNDDEVLTSNDGGRDSHGEMIVTDDDDELFELDITLLRGVDNEDVQDRHDCHSAGDGAHALMANCLLPVSSVSTAVPVTDSNIISSYYAFSTYSSSRKFGISGGGRRRLGRAAADGRSSTWARFRLSSRGFATVGNFQR
ncbi:uncharacterized protein LOC123397891 [Hordeum vulgare subsp. vulgare]|uniref:Uncharacterized protein n=1 Tax=Hordeum vulgare subsp. vulgare TaxID=112509 RepID=A0A8I6YF12_HORVV|nr:uncharacterized protein LOC123397891 [Hordeum vulgare subsp. vulgare]KAI4991983.1 hypothetical protein ZWY2020_040369 [Hordeum vulgare]